MRYSSGMMTLDTYMLNMGRGESQRKLDFCRRCGTSWNLLRQVARGQKSPSVTMCIAIERGTRGDVRCETLRPDIDWLYLKRRK